MEQFKIKHTKPGADTFRGVDIVEKIIEINDNLTIPTIEDIHSLIYRASEVNLLHEVVAIAMSEARYCSIVKVAGMEPDYMDIPVTIQAVAEPVLKFKAKAYILYPEDVRYINTGRK